MKAYYKARKAAGLCVKCGKKDARPNRVTCEPCGKAHAKYCRKKINMIFHGEHVPKTAPDLTGVDLTRPAQELAKELGCSTAIIHGARRRQGIPIPKRGPREPKINWDEVDLHRPIIDLQRELKTSYRRIRKARQQRGIVIPRGRQPKTNASK